MSLIKELTRRAALSIPSMRQVFTERDRLRTERDQLRDALASAVSDVDAIKRELKKTEIALSKADLSHSISI